MPPDKTSNSTKRLPACDACKHRRIKCNPAPPPGSCPQCIAKCIACKSTPTMRKKAKERSGVRIEMARNVLGAIKPLHEATPVPLVRAENFLVQLELSGELAAHLLDLYSKTPRDGLIPGAILNEKFEASGRRIAMLPRTTQVFALCVLALSSRFSSHPLLFGPGPPPPRLSRLLFDPSIDRATVVEWTRKRENACKRLEDLAIESAWQARLITGGADALDGSENVSNEATAACLLLDTIGDRNEPNSGFQWNAVFVSLVRKKVEAMRRAWAASTSPSGNNPDSSDSSAPRVALLGWSMQIMRVALSSAARGVICPYTPYDEELLSGSKPATPEKVLEHGDSFGIAERHPPRESYDGEEYRAEWWDFGSFYCLVRPFTYRMIEVSLKGYEWSLHRGQRKPFDISTLESLLASLVPLQGLLNLMNQRMSVLLSPSAVEIRGWTGRGGAFAQATGEKPGEVREMHKNDAPDQEEQQDLLRGSDGIEGAHSPRDEFRAQLSARTYHMVIRSAMGAILVPVYLDLEERIYAIDRGCGCPGDNRNFLEELLRAVRKALLPHALGMMKDIRSVVRMGWATTLGASMNSSLRFASGSTSTSPQDSSSEQPTSSSSATPDLTYSASFYNDPAVHSSVSSIPLARPNTFSWEAKLLQLMRTCIPPRLYSRETGRESYAFWTKIILDSPVIEDGGTRMTRTEKAKELRSVLDVARILSWTYPPMPASLINLMEYAIHTLTATGESPKVFSDFGSSSVVPSDSSRPAAMPARPSARTTPLPYTIPAVSILTLKEARDGIPNERVPDIFFGGSGAVGFGIEPTDDVASVVHDLTQDLAQLSLDTSLLSCDIAHTSEANAPGLFELTSQQPPRSSVSWQNPADFVFDHSHPSSGIPATYLRTEASYPMPLATNSVQLETNWMTDPLGWQLYQTSAGDTLGQDSYPATPTHHLRLHQSDAGQLPSQPAYQSAPFFDTAFLEGTPFSQTPGPITDSTLHYNLPSAAELDDQFQRMLSSGVAGPRSFEYHSEQGF